MRVVALAMACALCACSSREEIVRVYSPHGEDILRDYEALYEAAHPEVDLQWLDMGSQEVYNRVSAEANNPACDVWWGGPSSMFIQAADKGLLASYKPSWSDEVAPTDRNGEDLWYGTHLTPLSVMFNTRHYTREDVPQTWDDFLQPEWSDKLAIRKPLPSGTMRTFIGAMVLQAENEDAGFEWLKKFHEQTKTYLESPQLLFDNMKRNEEMVTVWIMPDAVLQRERNGYPFDFVLPPNTPVLTEGIAIVEGAPNRARAEEFYEFVTTIEALAHQAEVYGKIPARKDVPEEELPDWMVEQPIDAMAIDWKNFAEHEREWCSRWEQEVYNAP